MIGATLAHYRITAALGAGGMGEVYRATDTRLGRDVALKVLHGDRDEDPELRSRFEREARTIAGLSHPHICTLYDVGEHEGRHFLVMECLEGETLAARLERGPLPLAEAVAVATQILAALAAAHARGIVHRDLKPANVMLTRSGAKLLDFGLARLHAASHHLEGSAANAMTASVELPGRLVGTVPYMAPEQIEGRNAGPSSDLWAFGAMLFEIVTGRRAFPGESTAAVMAAILSSAPPVAPSPGAGVSPLLDRLIRACLVKDPERRWQSATDAAAALGWLDEIAASTEPLQQKTAGKVWPWLAGAGAVAATVLGLMIGRGLAPPAPVELPLRFSIEPPPGTALANILIGTGLAVAPDGRSIAFVAQGDGPPLLWLWSLEDESPRELENTAGAASPFWSPDGRSIAFFAEGTLRRIELESGLAGEICDAPFGAAGTWVEDDRLVFSEWAGETEGLWIVSATGGTPEMLPGSGPDESSFSRTWPIALPDGRRYLYLRGGYRGLAAEPQLCIGSFDSAEEQCLGRSDSRAGFVPPDLLLFVRGGTLMAQRVDLDTSTLLASPVQVAADPWWFSPSGAAEFSSSADGRTLVVRRDPGASMLQWYDRGGNLVGTLGEEARYFWPRLSPDGRSLAVRVRDPQTGVGDIWLLSTTTGIANRLTFEGSDTQSPIWSPDGLSLAYGASRRGPPDIFLRHLASGSERTLVSKPGTQIPRDLSPDGRLLAYEDFSPSRRVANQIWLQALAGGEAARPLSSAPASQHSPRFSPDGSAIAFVSEESGRPEVYVMPIDRQGAKVRVSPAGGNLPRWKGDGSELYYLARDGMVTAADVRLRPQLEVGAGRPLFPAPGPAAARPLFRSPGGSFLDYDVDASAERFLFTVLVRGEGDTLSVAVSWQTAAAIGGGTGRSQSARKDAASGQGKRRS